MTHCWTKCYGPDSLVVNHDSRVPTSFANSILSPPIALPEDWDGMLRLAYDAYIDPAECFAVMVTWGMLATELARCRRAGADLGELGVAFTGEIPEAEEVE